MKKLTAILLAIIFVISFSACSELLAPVPETEISETKSSDTIQSQDALSQTKPTTEDTVDLSTSESTTGLNENTTIQSTTTSTTQAVTTDVTVPPETTSTTATATQTTAATTQTQTETSSSDKTTLPNYSDSSFAVLNNNIPNFTESDLATKAYEYYSELDHLGRCGVTFACIGQEIMPTEERGSIGQVKPTGWHTVKYDIVDGKYLYNRCHLIGYQLTGENANVCNLITGTRSMNVDGMLPFEDMVADYIKETGNHVLYRVSPVFEGDELLARGVIMEGFSVEDNGEGICFNVYVFNAQPGIEIDYATGESKLAATEATTTTEKTTSTTKATSKSTAQTTQATPPPITTQATTEATTETTTQTTTETTTQTTTQTATEATTQTTEQTTPESQPEPPAADIQTYVLNTNSKKFHYPSCGSVTNMKESNKKVMDATRDEVIALGYTPCGNCHP